MRSEHRDRLVRGEDADQDERDAVAAQTPRKTHAFGLAGLDDSRIRSDEIGFVPHPHDRLMPKPPNYVLQQGIDVVVRLAQNHAGHTRSIAAQRRECIPIMV